MLAHVVLFRPRESLTEAERRSFLDALERARTGIPTIRRFWVGRRRVHGAGYEERVPVDFPYAAVITFDDLAGLRTYLQHPAHEDLGRLFSEATEAALVFDYELSEDLREIARHVLPQA